MSSKILITKDLMQKKPSLVPIAIRQMRDKSAKKFVTPEIYMGYMRLLVSAPGQPLSEFLHYHTKRVESPPFVILRQLYFFCLVTIVLLIGVRKQKRLISIV